MKYTATLLAFAIVLLAGCREYVVDPALDANPTPEFTPPDVPGVYIKGPNRLVLGEEYLFKADDITGASYEWVVVGPPRLPGNANGTRFFRGVASSVGPATVRVYAKDINDNLIAFGTRSTEVLVDAGEDQ